MHHRLRHLTMACLMLCINYAGTTFATTLSNGIAAVVGQDIITNHQFQREINVAQISLKRRHQQLPPTPALKRMVLNEMVNNLLQLRIAEQNKITATPKEVKHFTASLAKQNHINVDTLYQDMKRAGFNHDEAVKKLKEQFTIVKIQHMAVEPKIKITASEVKQIQDEAEGPDQLQQFHIHDLRIDLPDNATAAQKTAAMHYAVTLRKQILKDKTGLQQYHKKHPSGSMHFADMGLRRSDTIPDAFTPALENMNYQDISFPLETENGVHLIQLVNRRAAAPGLSKRQAENIVYQRQFGENLEVWINQLRADTYIHIPDHA